MNESNQQQQLDTPETQGILSKLPPEDRQLVQGLFNMAGVSAGFGMDGEALVLWEQFQETHNLGYVIGAFAIVLASGFVLFFNGRGLYRLAKAADESYEKKQTEDDDDLDEEESD